MFEALESVFNFWVAKAIVRTTSVTKNQCELCKAWNYTITVIAVFRGGFTVFLKYADAYMVSDTPLRLQPSSVRIYKLM